MSETITVNPISEGILVGIISSLFDEVAYIDPGVLDKNIHLACEGGMSKADRSIRADFATYLLENIAVVYMGLISNTNFRESFKDAVAVEISLDRKNEEFIKKLRNDMRDPDMPNSKGKFVINLCNENQAVYDKLFKLLAKSGAAIKPFDEDIAELVSELSEDSKIDIGFCISNFMYLIRALDKNQAFAVYVKSVIDSVRTKLAIA